MPDHLHAIVQLSGCASTLSGIVQAYKSITTLEIKPVVRVDRVWQRNFHDRIIRNEDELAAVRKYIGHNDIVHSLRSETG
jgi:putative transposase